MRRRCLHFALPLIACFATVSGHAQSSASDASAPPVFKTNAQAVTVDVVVTRGGDEPVAGLKKQDFQVLEDGKPQSIDLFEERTAASAAAIVLPPLPANVYTNLPATPRSAAVNILLLDSLNTPEEDQAFVRQQIDRFLAGLQPGARIAVYALNTRLRLLQDFTADPALLRAAVDSKAAQPATNRLARTRNDDLRDKEELEIIGELSNTGGADSGLPLKSIANSFEEQTGNQAGQRASITLAALQQIARSLAAAPGRKNLIWFARTFPVAIFPNGPNKQTLAGGKEIGDAVRATADLLTEAKVALYPVSAQGVTIDRTTHADSGGQPQGDNFESNPMQETSANDANRAAMEQLAADTGGEPFYTGNDLGKSVERAIQNGSHYYTLVYTPPNKMLDGKFHKIEVRLVEQKAKLAYRRGYYAADAGDAKPAVDPLPPLLARGLPAATEIVYEARVASLQPQPAADAPRAGGNAELKDPLTRYKVDFLVSSIALGLETGADGNHTGKLEVALIAYDKEGHPRNWTGKTLPVNLNAAAYEQVKRYGISVHLQVDLPAGEAEIVTGIYDLTARRAGTLTLPLPAETAAAAVGATAPGRLKLEKPAPPR